MKQHYLIISISTIGMNSYTTSSRLWKDLNSLFLQVALQDAPNTIGRAKVARDRKFTKQYYMSTTVKVEPYWDLDCSTLAPY